jgi:SHS2 domain-containing protein
MYEVFEHTADVGLRITARDRAELYAQAARALFSLIVDDPATVRPVRSLHFRVEGQDDAYLLFDWLNELLYTFDTQRTLLVEFEVTLTPAGLEATARGEPYDPAHHRLEHEIKAITYHGLEVRPHDGGWLAEVILDI